MVKDNVNLYFTNLLKDLQNKYSGLKGGQVFKATPPSFPYMYFNIKSGYADNQRQCSNCI